MEINLITHNPGKVKEFKNILEPNIKVNHLDLEYPEIRSDDPIEIATIAAEQLSKLLNKTVVVEDSGLFIDTLNGFPGTCSAYIHKRIGLKGLLKLLKGTKNRTAYYKSAVSYCEPKNKAVTFLGQEKGKISTKILGKNGFGHDPIFIPKNSKKTYGQMPNYKDKKQFRKQAIKHLLDHLNNQSQ